MTSILTDTIKKYLMNYSRRTAIKAGAFTLAGAWVTPGLSSSVPISQSTEKFRYEDHHKLLIDKAIDAAISAGASYADARISFTQNLIPRSESIEFGIRALVQGYWGFSSGPVLTEEEAARLGYSCAQLAKANLLGGERVVSLAPLDPESGNWSMPVKDDPFEMDFDEIVDFTNGILAFMKRLKNLTSPRFDMRFVRQRKTFGSSQGQAISQLLYRTSGSCSFGVEIDVDGIHDDMGVKLDCLTPAGLGFEYFRDRPLRGYITEAYEEALRDVRLPIKPIDVGKYPVLINPIGIASILSQTIGEATQIDRAMGYEANSVGTSYINDPVSMINSLRIGNSLVNVLGNRSRQGSVGRVRWDDEGVQPADFTLVDQGLLVNMQTSREGVAWLGDVGKIQSTGSMYTPTAIDSPLIHSTDLTLSPENDNTLDMNAIREGVDDGIEFKWPDTTMDFQQITGYTRGNAYEIKKGKRVARLASAGMIFRTPEFWNNVAAIGGLESSSMFGLGTRKGEPGQLCFHGVTTPPVLLKDMSIIDITRKA